MTDAKSSPHPGDFVKSRYDLPDEVRYCARCVVSNQRPRIVLDAEGVCNACRFAERKETAIDWEERDRELKELCARFRRDDGRFDVIVPSSGGKDSGYVAHLLKHRYAMHPLTVTWAPNIYTEVGWKNFQALIRAGFDNILGTPNGQVHRRLTRLCLEDMCEPFQPFILGQVWFPVSVAVRYGIPLIMDGENGEAEYGGDSEADDKPGFTIADVNRYWFSNRPMEYWRDFGFSPRDFALYAPPSERELSDAKIERRFFSYYKKWMPQEHFYYVVEHTGFEPNPDGRSEGTYSKYASLDDRIDGFHFWFMLLKFGIGRATSDAAQEVRNGQITRAEAVALVRRYDTEFPQKHFAEFLDYCDLTEDQFWEICEKWRNPNLWVKTGNEWTLRGQVEDRDPSQAESNRR